MFTIGIEPHKGCHTATAVNADEVVVGQVRVVAHPHQRARLLEWAAPFEPRIWAIEGATDLNGLGADHRTSTPVYRTGTVDGQGTLTGNLLLVGQGDLTFGGRRINANTIQVTDLDHGDANALGTAQLTPQDPLYGIDQLAAQVKAAGITTVNGDVAVDDRVFKPYRVPNGNLLVTPILVNENLVDVTITPTQPGLPATVEYRPKTAAFSIDSTVTTGPRAARRRSSSLMTT